MPNAGASLHRLVRTPTRLHPRKQRGCCAQFHHAPWSRPATARPQPPALRCEPGIRRNRRRNAMGETPTLSREQRLEALAKDALDTLVSLKNGDTWDEHVLDVDSLLDEARDLGVEVSA
jgi:hypothetical protein